MELGSEPKQIEAGNSRRARLELSFAQRQLLAKLRTLYSEAQTGRAELDSWASRRNWPRRLRLTTLRYQAGEATVLEVVDAQSAGPPVAQRPQRWTIAHPRGVGELADSDGDVLTSMRNALATAHFRSLAFASVAMLLPLLMSRLRKRVKTRRNCRPVQVATVEKKSLEHTGRGGGDFIYFVSQMHHVAQR